MNKEVKDKECWCGNKSAKRWFGRLIYPGGECSRDCALAIFSVMKKIKDATSKIE